MLYQGLLSEVLETWRRMRGKLMPNRRTTISPRRIPFRVRRFNLISLNHKQHSVIATKAIACVVILEHVRIALLAHTRTPFLYIDDVRLRNFGMDFAQDGGRDSARSFTTSEKTIPGFRNRPQMCFNRYQ
jgi:hypothetical protein